MVLNHAEITNNELTRLFDKKIITKNMQFKKDKKTKNIMTVNEDKEYSFGYDKCFIFPVDDYLIDTRPFGHTDIIKK